MKTVLLVSSPWTLGGWGAIDTLGAPGSSLSLADLLEVRLDVETGHGFDFHQFCVEVPAEPRFLVTVRSAREGGRFAGTPEEAAGILLGEDVLPFASWVDAEGPVAPLVAPRAREAGRRVLASFHGTGPHGLPAEGVDAWKVARPVHDAASLAAALEEARALAASSRQGEHPPAFVVPLGPLGAGLRVVTAALAQAGGVDAFVYGVPDEGYSSAAEAPDASWAAGVPCLRHLVDEGRLGEVTGEARLFGLVGRPPSRSPSPAIHNAVFRSLGLDAVYLPEADLDAASALALPYAGWSVTTPLKEEVAARCHDLEPVARRCGAVNTVVAGEGGRLRGSNTDALAVREAVRARRAGPGAALVVGGGGFARAATAALLEDGWTVRIAGRGERARKAAQALGVEHVGARLAARPNDLVVVNATPEGGDGGLPPEWAALVSSCAPATLVLDAPYAAGGRPAAVAKAARARGLDAEDGPSLLVRQAAAQALRFTGRPADPAVLACARASGADVVLVGPRGAGKTTVGRALARRLGRPFVDTDEEIARAAGRPAGEVLAEHGEAAFRDLEAREVARAMARRGAVVALGGGALLRRESAAAVARAGFVVRLTVGRREAARRLAADPTPRPPLTGAPDAVAEAGRLARQRGPGYARLAAATVATDGRAVEAIAQEIAPLAARALTEPDRRA